MDSVRSSSPLFSDSDRLELSSLAQGNLISFDPEEESRNETSGSQDRVVSNSPGIPCAQTVQDNLSQGIQTSPVMEASPVQQIQDVYGSPSCEEDLTPHRVEEKCTNEELASLRKQIESLLERESIAEKALKTIAELEQKVSKLMEQVESLTKIGLAKTKSYQSNWKNRPDQFRNQNNGNSIPTGNCFGCGQQGHFRNACLKIKKTQFKSVSERQETSQSNTRTVTRKGLWFVPGTIEGIKVEMLIDSGSDRVLVDSKFYNSIPAAARPRLGPSTWSVDTISGSPVVSIGEADFQLQIGNQTLSYPFVVADLGLRRISVVIGHDFLEDNKCLVDMGHGFLRIKDEKILMRREFSADDRIVEQKEQVNSDEPKIAAEIPEPREVASLRESSPLSETSTKTRTSRKKQKRKRRSQAQHRIWNVKWNDRQKFHGPWQY